MRPGVLQTAEWNEIDFETATWRIPANKMKMREKLLVPLSHQAISILKDLQVLTGHGKYLFPAQRSDERPISNNTLNAGLRLLGYGRDEIVTHGFRATASTLLNEQGWAPDIIEKQLAHQERSKVRAAYNRAEYLDKRREMMQFWANYLDSLKLAALT